MSEDLKVTVKRGDGYVLVYTDGYINDTKGDRVAEECSRVLEEGHRNFILNLEKSKIISSIGISILIEVIERVGEVGGSLSFCSLTPTIAKTFQIMRLTDWAKIYDDEEEAIGAMVA